MWDYTETVKEHFFNPRNVGMVDEANAVGDVGSIQCGDALRLSLKVDEASETIVDARFQTFGCGSAIASSSALTEMVKGKTLTEAMAISNQEIADYLGGLPPEKMHCSVMGKEALEAAVANYRGEVWADDHEEGALVCKCFGLHEGQIEKAVKENRLSTLEEVTHYTKAGGGCACCHEAINDIILRCLDEQSEPVPVAAAPAPEPAVPAMPKSLTNLERMRRVEEVITSMRPQFKADGGDIRLVDIDKRIVYVEMEGSCAGCMGASLTLEGVQESVMNAIGEPMIVVPVERTPESASGQGEG